MILVGYASIQDFYVPIANKPIVWVEPANFYRRQEALNIVDIASRLQDVDVSAVGSWDAKIARAAMFSPYEMGRFAMERRDFRLQKWGGLHDKESWYNIYIIQGLFMFTMCTTIFCFRQGLWFPEPILGFSIGFRRSNGRPNWAGWPVLGGAKSWGTSQVRGRDGRLRWVCRLETGFDLDVGQNGRPRGPQMLV